jgi:hypothetical protein
MNPRSLRYAISLWWYQTFVCPHDEWQIFADEYLGRYVACHQCGNLWKYRRQYRFLKRKEKEALEDGGGEKL